MRKFLITAIPIFILIIFICIMHSGHILKKPIGKNDDIIQSINDMIEMVNDDSWDEADSKLKDLNKAWDKVLKRAQFASERDEINSFSTCIARLRGAVMAKDKSAALMELYEADNHWRELGR